MIFIANKQTCMFEVQNKATRLHKKHS